VEGGVGEVLFCASAPPENSTNAAMIVRYLDFIFQLLRL
jgi:hypothetical protein